MTSVAISAVHALQIALSCSKAIFIHRPTLDAKALVAAGGAHAISYQSSAINDQPSTISRSVQALVEDVGVALFLRHTRAVEMTSAGAHSRSARACGPHPSERDDNLYARLEGSGWGTASKLSVLAV